MVSLEEILLFMKQDKVDRAEQRKEDMQERVQQREKDMNMIKEMIQKGVRAEVLAAMEPICRRQEKLEEEQKCLRDKLERMAEEMKNLKVADQETAIKEVNDLENYTKIDKDDENEEKKKIISSARRTVGLFKIKQADVNKHVQLGSEDENEAMLQAVKAFMVEEMKVNEEEASELHIEKVFPPARADWSILYVRFVSESSVHKLYSHTRNMKATLRLVPYIPKQFYTKYRELESQAYQLRHCEVKYKTRIKMGTSDLILYKRESSSNSWSIVTHTQNSTSHNQSEISEPQLNLRPNSGFNCNSTSSS